MHPPLISADLDPAHPHLALILHPITAVTLPTTAVMWPRPPVAHHTGDTQTAPRLACPIAIASVPNIHI